jgi:hypothetical protein
VKAGDTLTSIAGARRTTVAVLLSLNALKGADKISVGQKLRLPTAGPAKPSAPRYEPFPGTAFFRASRRSPLGERLVELGFGKHYTSGPRTRMDGGGPAQRRGLPALPARAGGRRRRDPGPQDVGRAEDSEALRPAWPRLIPRPGCATRSWGSGPGRLRQEGRQALVDARR